MRGRLAASTTIENESRGRAENLHGRTNALRANARASVTVSDFPFSRSSNGRIKISSRIECTRVAGIQRAHGNAFYASYPFSFLSAGRQAGKREGLKKLGNLSSVDILPVSRWTLLRGTIPFTLVPLNATTTARAEIFLVK